MRQRYGNHRGASGVTHYEPHPQGITVHFGDRSYRYTHASAGKAAVDAMKRLARRGHGLATYIRATGPKHAGE